MSAADALEGNAALDTLFRQQLTDLLATRLLAAHTGAPTTFQPIMGGLSPNALRRAIERLRSDSDTDVSLAALASDAGLSRFHFCRAFKESTGLSPHAWLRQHRLEQAMNMLRDTDASVVSVASGAWLCLANRLRRGVQEADRRDPERLADGACVSSNRSTGTAIALGQWQLRSGRSSRCPRSQQTETNDDLEELRQPTCNHVTTERPRDRSRVRTFVGCSLHFGNGRGGGNSAAIRATRRIP